MHAVIAVGGNALLKRGEILSFENQQANMRASANAIAEIAREHSLTLVHGNGPQVGLLALEADAYKGAPPYPLDVLGAESQGMIGYIIVQEMMRALPGRAMAALLTRTRVDAGDPAFARPSKPIGPIYGEAEAKALAAERGWAISPDGNAYRRVVASPEPRGIVEIGVIRLLVDAGVMAICLGGGGVPVAEAADGTLEGVEAVIDKDLAAQVLAVELGADRLLILTDVDGVYLDWKGPDQRLLRAASARELKAGDFAQGSMGPKVAAACRFAEATGRPAFIGNLADAGKVMAGETGTRIDP
jgi:carbamate kinase